MSDVNCCVECGSSFNGYRPWAKVCGDGCRASRRAAQKRVIAAKVQANGKQKQYKNKYLSDPTNREANRKAALEYYRSHRAERHEYYERTKERREQRRRERLADPSTNLKARQALWSFQRRARRAKASVGDDVP